MKFYGFIKLNSTIAIRLYDPVKDILNQYFMQITLKDPWFIPHKEKRWGEHSWVFGWIFFYFGNIASSGQSKSTKESDK